MGWIVHAGCCKNEGVYRDDFIKYAICICLLLLSANHSTLNLRSGCEVRPWISDLHFKGHFVIAMIHSFRDTFVTTL